MHFETFRMKSMLWQGVVHTLLPLAGGILMLFFLQWRSTEEPPSHWMNPIGREGCLMAVAFSVLLWIAPYGALLALPILFCLSVISHQSSSKNRMENTCKKPICCHHPRPDVLFWRGHVASK